ncbi:MAG: nuclear transport factor 2 family protein [Lysobacteraceae bacterium]|nr:MAG: nuclear transport factor 2 family protein [Xanthomonadaceae bacterium]
MKRAVHARIKQQMVTVHAHPSREYVMSEARMQDIEKLERAFWQSILEGDSKAATAMLTEPALMVSGHGSNRFDHAGYEKMASDDRFKLLRFELSDMDVTFPRDDVAVATYHASQTVRMEGREVQMEAHDSSTWVRIDGAWKCVVHTESLVPPSPEP